MIVIEMNPRVSRSSALASKATGFPIAKIAAKVAIGYTLDEIPNDITEETPASFEPTLDYVVVKVPRFAFEKFPAAEATLTTHMKSVGEAMAIGRNFTEALGKALRSLEDPKAPFDLARPVSPADVDELLSRGRPARTTAGCSVVMQALRAGATPEQVLRGDQDRSLVPRPAGAADWRWPTRSRRAAELTAGPAADGQAARLLRRPDRRAAAPARGRGPRGPLGPRDPAGLQDGGHLRGRVRRQDARTTTAPTTTRPRSSRGPGRRC